MVSAQLRKPSEKVQIPKMKIPPTNRLVGGIRCFSEWGLRTLTILGGCLCTLRGRKGRATAQTVHVNPMRAHSMSWMTMPVRSLGSNQVALGGMMLPVSAMRITCSIVTG